MTEEEFQKAHTGLMMPSRRVRKEPEFGRVFNRNTPLRIPFDIEREGLPEHVNWYKEGKVSRPYD